MNATPQAPSGATGRPATKAGDVLTKRDGSRVQGPAMKFSAPHWVFDGGVAIKDYGDDETAAFEHYDQLLAAHRARLGITGVLYGH